MKIFIKAVESMTIYEIHNIYGIYLFWKKKMGYILYSEHITASHICPAKKINRFNRETENQGFPENMDFDV